MNDNARKRRANRYLRLLGWTERNLERRLAQEFQRTVRAVASATLNLSTGITQHTLRLTNLFSESFTRAATIGYEQGVQATATTGLPTVEELRSQVATIARERARSEAIQVATTTRTRITNEIARGVEARLPPEAIARNIVDNVGGMSRARARTIARTETAGAANVAQQATVEAAVQATGVRLAKVWTATGDERTRPSHEAADGQRRPIAEPFSVGGASLMHPSDPAGPPGEVINCRCVAVYEPY